MRGLLLVTVYFSLLPLIFFKSPYIGILMWYWISLMNPQKIVWTSIFASVNFSFVVAVLTLICWLFSRTEPKFPPFSRTTQLILLLMIWISITSLFGIGPDADIEMWWSLSEKMLLMTLVAYAWTDRVERLEQLIVVCALSVTFFGVRGGLGTIMHGGVNRVYGPDDTMIGDNNDLGVALTLFLPLLFYMRQRYTQTYFKWPLLGVIGLTFIGTIFTYSRGALLGISAMGLMLWLRSRQKTFVAVLIVVGLVGVYEFAPPEWFDRMHTIETYQDDESAESRLYMWQLSWEMTLLRPIVGGGLHWGYAPATVNNMLSNSGLPPLTRARAPHSIWFEMLGSHGFPGLILFLAILWNVLLNAHWLVRQSRGRPGFEWADNLGRMLQVSIIGFLVGGSFATLAMYDGFYAVVVIAAAARAIVVRELGQTAEVRAAGPVRATPSPQVISSGPGLV